MNISNLYKWESRNLKLGGTFPAHLSQKTTLQPSAKHQPRPGPRLAFAQPITAFTRQLLPPGHENPREGLSHRLLGQSGFSRLGWGSRIYISNKIPGGADAAGPPHHVLRTTVLKVQGMIFKKIIILSLRGSQCSTRAKLAT